MKAKLSTAEIFFDIDGMGFVPVEGRMVERPVLFMVHGGPGGDHSSFKTQCGALRDVAQLVYIDHRGSGRSGPADPETYDLDHNIDDLDGLREYLGLERISMLGSSYGGMVAQGYAIRYPDRVANLILSATAPSYRVLDEAQQIVRQRGTPDQQRVCEWLWEGSFENAQQLYEYYRLMGPMYSRKFDLTKFEANWPLGIRNHEQLNRGFADFLRRFDFIDQLEQITCPTLVLAGAHDWICPPSQSRIIAERIPRAHLKIFADSAHQIAADENEAYLAAVRGFLTYAAE